MADRSSQVGSIMDKRQVSRVLRITDRERARAAQRVRKYDAECKAIDGLMDGANEWIRHG